MVRRPRYKGRHAARGGPPLKQTVRHPLDPPTTCTSANRERSRSEEVFPSGMGTLCAQSARQKDHRQEEERGEDEEQLDSVSGTGHPSERYRPELPHIHGTPKEAARSRLRGSRPIMASVRATSPTAKDRLVGQYCSEPRTRDARTAGDCAQRSPRGTRVFVLCRSGRAPRSS
jgi:hypothetical protein